jgi:hypothetical protein
MGGMIAETIAAQSPARASPGYNTDEAELRELLGLTFNRGTTTDRYARQLGAISATGKRTQALRQITAPRLVIHGLADRLVAPSGGHATRSCDPERTRDAPRRRGRRPPP